jgi:hypothetical protein
MHCCNLANVQGKYFTFAVTLYITKNKLGDQRDVQEMRVNIVECPIKGILALCEKKIFNMNYQIFIGSINLHI